VRITKQYGLKPDLQDTAWMQSFVKECRSKWTTNSKIWRIKNFWSI